MILHYGNSVYSTLLRYSRLLQTFRLPGESQVIDRIMEQFAQHFHNQNPNGIFATPDSVYVLAFSVIMLNTDAHNPQVKIKMTKAEFLRNNRGINNGADIPAEYLEKIYDRYILFGLFLTLSGLPKTKSKWRKGYFLTPKRKVG